MALRGDRPDTRGLCLGGGAAPEGAWVLAAEAIAWIHRDQRLVPACATPSPATWWGEIDVPGLRARQTFLLVNPAVPPNAGDDCLLIQGSPPTARAMR